MKNASQKKAQSDKVEKGKLDFLFSLETLCTKFVHLRGRDPSAQPLIFYFESIQRIPVLQVKIVTLRKQMIYQIWNFGGIFAECLMRWDFFLTAFYWLVSRAWTILLKSRTFLRRAIIVMEQIMCFLQSKRITIMWMLLIFEIILTFQSAVLNYFFLFKGTHKVYCFIVKL